MVFEVKWITRKEESDMEEFLHPGLMEILSVRNGIALEIK